MLLRHISLEFFSGGPDYLPDTNPRASIDPSRTREEGTRTRGDGLKMWIELLTLKNFRSVGDPGI